jgi:hypothetical protein
MSHYTQQDLRSALAAGLLSFPITHFDHKSDWLAYCGLTASVHLRSRHFWIAIPMRLTRLYPPLSSIYRVS